MAGIRVFRLSDRYSFAFIYLFERLGIWSREDIAQFWRCHAVERKFYLHSIPGIEKFVQWDHWLVDILHTLCVIYGHEDRRCETEICSVFVEPTCCQRLSSLLMYIIQIIPSDSIHYTSLCPQKKYESAPCLALRVGSFRLAGACGKLRCRLLKKQLVEVWGDLC